jgi:hypothetical protein
VVVQQTWIYSVCHVVSDESGCIDDPEESAEDEHCGDSEDCVEASVMAVSMICSIVSTIGSEKGAQVGRLFKIADRLF